MNASQPAIKLYGVPFSVHTRKVILAARLKSVPLELVPVAPVAPDTLPPNWRRISPTGLIPAIDDAGYVLADSTAILLYLERKFPAPALLPAGLADYGRALFLDAWAGSALFRNVVHPVFHNKVVFPKLRGKPGDQTAIAIALDTTLPEALAYLESLEPQDFFVGATLSIADLTVISNLIVLNYLGHRIDARYPKLAAYFRRHVTSDSLREVLAREEPFAKKLGLVFEV
jgi:glutathione S-transferase